MACALRNVFPSSPGFVSIEEGSGTGLSHLSRGAYIQVPVLFAAHYLPQTRRSVCLAWDVLLVWLYRPLPPWTAVVLVDGQLSALGVMVLAFFRTVRACLISRALSLPLFSFVVLHDSCSSCARVCRGSSATYSCTPPSLTSSRRYSARPRDGRVRRANPCVRPRHAFTVVGIAVLHPCRWG